MILISLQQFMMIITIIISRWHHDHSMLIPRVATTARSFAETIPWHHFMHHNLSYLVISICHNFRCGLSSHPVILSFYPVISICHILQLYLVISICLIFFTIISYHFLPLAWVTFCHQYLLHFFIFCCHRKCNHCVFNQYLLTVGKSEVFEWMSLLWVYMMSAFTGVVVFKCHIMEESRRYTMCSTNGSSDIADVRPTLFLVLFQCGG